MKSFYTVGLLIVSNIFMTFAWYGHLKLQQMHISTSWPLIGIIVFSWVIAFFEYCVMVPANRIGFVDNGGPFSLVELKVIQEVISLRDKGLARDAVSMQGLGYKQLLKYLDGEMTLEQAVENLKQVTRNYAKRQMTWCSTKKSVRHSAWIFLTRQCLRRCVTCRT